MIHLQFKANRDLVAIEVTMSTSTARLLAQAYLQAKSDAGQLRLLCANDRLQDVYRRMKA